MADDPVRVGAPYVAGASGNERLHRRLHALETLLAEQRSRIARYVTDRSALAQDPVPGARTPPRPLSLPEIPTWELLDALPLPVMVVLPERGAKGSVTGFSYMGQNAAAWDYCVHRFPPERLPPRTGAAPLFELFPTLGDTVVPRMLAEAHRTGRSQGPEAAEWSLPGHGEGTVRLSGEVRVAPRAGVLLLTWERGSSARRSRASQHLVRVSWVDWNLGDGSVEASAELRDVLGLPGRQPPPGLLELARMVVPTSVLPLYRAVRAVLLREQEVAECELRLPPPYNRIVRFVAEPVGPGGGPVWTVRAVLHDVTEDRRSRALAERAVAEARAQRERADTVAEVAERLRKAVLPSLPAELARHGIETSVSYHAEAPTVRVGGDWYKTRVLPTGQVLVAIGDARGHGLDAVTLMAKLRYALTGLAFTGEPVELLTSWLNAVACDDGDESTATAVVGHYSPDLGLLRWTCAGHPQPVLVHGRRARRLDPPPGGPGLPLGVLPDEKYVAAETFLDPGDMVLLYSDGLVEHRASDPDRDAERLLRAAETYAHAGIPSGDEALDAYVRDVVRHLTGPHPGDDSTLLAFRRIRTEHGGC
ncbi:PP2C family protein-serine/threonine phosphatase [Streptomyces sp. LB8]|uniref:PP2C family protein-serine/threonine phosphatase n=1 Tax=Streptomyces sp. LB8 TaxID=3042509 RepID=UPI002649A46B|nr:PP2C family protein-serine/threonine phosphatase [Streptomyces sp. LB8]MDN5384929.1 PP2C family protein-serine/threonine phosphatase [Streptomyces sp. LB8]